MGQSELSETEPRQRINAVLDSLLYGLSVFGVPLAIALMTVIALVAWEGLYPANGTPAEFRVAKEDAPMAPQQAWAKLALLRPVTHFDTRLSEAPFWFVFGVLALPDDDNVIELPSRHATNAACWQFPQFKPLGEANRREAKGQMEMAKGGFVVRLGRLDETVTVLCRAGFTGPARISVVQWPSQIFERSVQAFHRDSGLLDGGLMVLSLFVLVTAVINREWLYVLFAAWLMGNLRLAAISAGWDTQWFGRAIPPEWLVPMRKVTTMAYYVLTITLFLRLFRDDLKRVGYRALPLFLQWSCIPLLIGALILPFAIYLPYLWVSTAISIALILFLLARILLITRSTVAAWYTAALAITLFASLYEVISAALGMKGLIGAINSVTAALSSSLMAALAIAEQMRQERMERVRAQAELRHAYEAIPIGLFTLTVSGFFLQVNPALTRMLGVRGQRQEHWSQYFEQDAWPRLRELVAAGADTEIELQSLAAPGQEPKWLSVKATLAGDRIEGSLQDITERVKVTDRLRFYAEHDPLTGILNRRGIETVLSSAMAALGSGQPLVLAYIDLDRFKLINDLFGHAAGDEVLRQICDRVREMLEPGQEMGRVGGDEFVIVFRNTSIQSATWKCRGIIDRIGVIPYHIGDRAFHVRGSIGLVEIAPGTRSKDIISVADRACREAKSGPYGNLVVYEKSSRVFREREEELRLLERFGASAAPEGLFLMMQPIMSVAAPYDSLNFEALLRLREADGSITPAGKIIAAAERNGRISIVDRWVMSSLLDWLSENRERLKKTRFVCMNLSGGSLNDEKFVQDAFSMLAQYGRSVERLCIEITESVALHDLANTRRFTDKVRSFGAKIALDDFGAGYTSFSYLKELQADALKIDGAFIKGVMGHPANLAIVEAIVELARNLGMKSVAEWVEDRATLEALVHVGVDYVQGWAVAKPVAADKILLADSAADLIEDEQAALYVRNVLAAGRTMELWSETDVPSGIRLH